MSKRKGGDDGVHAQVSSLKRKHQQEAVLAGEATNGSLFWSKKVEQDIRSGAASLDAQELERERNAELERVRARRCGQPRPRCTALATTCKVLALNQPQAAAAAAAAARPT